MIVSMCFLVFNSEVRAQASGAYINITLHGSDVHLYKANNYVSTSTYAGLNGALQTSIWTSDSTISEDTWHKTDIVITPAVNGFILATATGYTHLQ